MKTKKTVFTLVGLMSVVIIVGVLTGCVDQRVPVSPAELAYGREAQTPTTGQVYLVTVADEFVEKAAVMPWKYGHDKASLTDRRLFLKVSKKVCKQGIWFVRGLDGEDNIIEPPTDEEMSTNIFIHVETYENNTNAVTRSS